MSHRKIIEEHIVLAFLEQFFTDCQRGIVRPVEHYFDLFPGADGRIRTEYEQLLESDTEGGLAEVAGGDD